MPTHNHQSCFLFHFDFTWYILGRTPYLSLFYNHKLFHLMFLFGWTVMWIDRPLHYCRVSMASSRDRLSKKSLNRCSIEILLNPFPIPLLTLRGLEFTYKPFTSGFIFHFEKKTFSFSLQNCRDLNDHIFGERLMNISSYKQILWNLDECFVAKHLMSLQANLRRYLIMTLLDKLKNTWVLLVAKYENTWPFGIVWPVFIFLVCAKTSFFNISENVYF